MAKRCSRVVPGLLMQCMKEDNDQQGCRCLLLADMNYTSLVAIFSVFVALRSRFPRQICMRSCPASDPNRVWDFEISGLMSKSSRKTLKPVLGSSWLKLTSWNEGDLAIEGVLGNLDVDL